MCDIKVRPDYHIGHVLLRTMREYSDLVCQIDAATGQQETIGSVLGRSIQLAKCLRNFGLKPGNVLAFSGYNHLDVFIPYYSALFNGLPIVGVDPNYKYDEINTLFKITLPKIAFCDEHMFETFVKVTRDLELDTKIIVFGKDSSKIGDNSFSKFIDTFDDEQLNDDFAVAEFDTEEIFPFLICTSGTTGQVKVAAFKQQAIATKMLHPSLIAKDTYKHTKLLNLSPVNWISAYFIAIATIFMGQIRVQTSVPDNFDIIIKMINEYKPVTTLFSPSMLASLLKRKDDVDLTCFRLVVVTGSKVYQDVLSEFQACLDKSAVAFESYGQTESIGANLQYVPGMPPGSSGKPHFLYSIKLADPDTGKEITEPHVPGEIRVKGPMFTGYYNDPEETAKAFSKDGYYKTGDLLYKDENDFYYFVDRIKSLIKYRNFHVLPVELEEVIRSHEGVSDVCVVGINDPDDGQRPVACVVRRNGNNVTAQQIMDLVSSKLSKHKQLRGGVVFLDEVPKTSTGKIARGKLTEIVLHSCRE